MHQAARDQRISLIDALGVELKIAKVTLPGLRDITNIAKTTAFTESIKRIWAYAKQLAQAAGLSAMTEDSQIQQPDLFPGVGVTLNLDPEIVTSGRIVYHPNADTPEQEVTEEGK